MSTDVNDSFAAERAEALDQSVPARVERGELTALGGEFYRVNTGWDAGETLRLVDGQLVPEHGLDQTTGASALYSAVPAWHGLGTVIPGGTSNVEEILEAARIDFTVATVPATYAWGDEVRTAPGKYATVRDDTGAALGVVGARYTPIQNRDAFAFLQDLTDTYAATWESAGALGGGEQVFVSMRLPETVTVDAGGIDDEIVPFVVVVNSHDGSSRFFAMVTPWRPVCRNSERFAVRDALTRWGVAHTRNAMRNVEKARRTMGPSVAYYEQFAAEETRLAQTGILLDDVDRLIGQLWPIDPDAPDRTRNNHATRRDAIVDQYTIEVDRVGATAYAAERAVTGYFDHLKPRRHGGLSEELARAAAAFVGNEDELKSRAHRHLMTLTR